MRGPAWYPFAYRDFHDVPRMIVVAAPIGRILLDCPLDPAIDGYPDRYQVYRLPDGAAIDALDWTTRAVWAQPIGSVPVGGIEFDPTRRSSLRAASRASLIGLAE